MGAHSLQHSQRILHPRLEGNSDNFVHYCLVYHTPVHSPLSDGILRRWAIPLFLKRNHDGTHLLHVQSRIPLLLRQCRGPPCSQHHLRKSAFPFDVEAFILPVFIGLQRDTVLSAVKKKMNDEEQEKNQGVKFMTRAQREAAALERRQREIEEKRRLAEELARAHDRFLGSLRRVVACLPRCLSSPS